MKPQSSKGDRSNLHVGLWPPHPLADSVHARRTFLSGQACFRFWRRWTSFPSPPILKARLPLSPSHMAMPSPHKCAILYAPISIAEVSESYFSVSIFPYFLISLYIYISIQFYKNIIVSTYRTTVLYLYFSFLLFLYLCFHICFYCSTSLFIEAVACRLPSLAFSCAKLWRPCQMPSTRRGLLIWLKLSRKPSANNSYLGIPEKFLPNSLAF